MNRRPSFISCSFVVRPAARSASNLSASRNAASVEGRHRAFVARCRTFERLFTVISIAMFYLAFVQGYNVPFRKHVYLTKNLLLKSNGLETTSPRLSLRFFPRARTEAGEWRRKPHVKVPSPRTAARRMCAADVPTAFPRSAADWRQGVHSERGKESTRIGGGSRHGGRGMRTRLCPRRRAVDRAAMRSYGNHFRQLALRWKVAGDIGIVGLWKCGIMRLWDYGIGSRRFQFQNSTISYFHNFTISQFITVVHVESVDIHYCLFHCHLPERQGPDFRPALHRIAEAQRSVYNPSRGSVGIVPNICLWRNGVRRQRLRMEAA